MVELISENEELFPYEHIVIDEGQDFGKEEIEKAEVLEWLQMLAEKRNGTFYFFYDKRQLVQGVSMPACVADADCKLTLYRNCRNTENIARCSLKALNDDSGKRVMLSSEAGSPPEMKASKDPDVLEGYIDSQIARLSESGIKDVVLLTCKTIESSSFKHLFSRKRNGYRWKNTIGRVYTCRTFKGLEADAVILLDVDKSLWEKPKTKYSPKEGLIFYTGASRAKFELRIAAEIDEEDCETLLGLFGVQSSRRPFKKLANVLGVVMA